MIQKEAVNQHFEKNFFYNRKLIETPVIQGKKVPNRAYVPNMTHSVTVRLEQA